MAHRERDDSGRRSDARGDAQPQDRCQNTAHQVDRPEACGARASSLLVLGFGFFVWLLPDEEIALDRNADGIVVLTGGTSRISDALELLSSGRGKRLLITGVNPGTTTTDIARQIVDYDRLFACCVDLDYSALNTLGNADADAALGASNMASIR